VHPLTHIKGTTRLYGLVGDPLTTAKSPELLNRLFIEQCTDAVCIPFQVEADDLSAFVTGARAVKNLSGVLVTMPHKQRMMPFVDELHPTARQVGALNVIRCDDEGRWVGAIFDGLGCVLGMHWEGNHPANKSVLLVGAGGAGRAIGFAVGSAGANDTQSHRLLNGSSASSDTNLSNDGNSGSVDGNAVSPRSTRNSEGVRASQDNTGRSALSRDTTTSGESNQPGSDNGSSPSIVNDGTPSGRKMSNDDADKNGTRNDSSSGAKTSTQRSTTRR